MNLRFGITGKLLVWFFAIIAIFYGTILVLYINVAAGGRAVRVHRGKNYAIASGTKKMTESLLSMEENKQKYLLLKKSDYLVFFNDAQHAFEDNLTQVTRLTAMGHDISNVWRDISDAYATYADAAEVAAYLAGKVKDPDAVNTFWPPESVVNDWIDIISVERMKNEQESNWPPRELNRKGRLSAKNGLIGLAISSLVGLLGIFYLAYSMIRPLRELMDGIREISSNRLGKPLEIRSQDEFGELAHAFNEMSSRLRKEERMRSDFISMLSHEIRTTADLHTRIGQYDPRRGNGAHQQPAGKISGDRRLGNQPHQRPAEPFDAGVTIGARSFEHAAGTHRPPYLRCRVHQQHQTGCRGKKHRPAHPGPLPTTTDRR